MNDALHAASMDEPRRLVRHRINFVNKLAPKQEEDNKTHELINADGKWYALPGKDYQGLRGYLLLTCFDILAKETKDIPKPLTSLYSDHAKDDDLRNNFYRFINAIIGTKRKQELLNSICIIKKDKRTDTVLPSVITSDEKLRLLFDVRCSYIHKEVASTPQTGESLNVNSREALTNDFGEYIYMQWKPAVLIAIIEEVVGNQC